MASQGRCDLLAIGSGAGGLSAAVRAAFHRLKVIMSEKESVLGGTTAGSGGWMWVPRSPLAQRAGVTEDKKAIRTYLRAERHTALQFVAGNKMPDVHGNQPGASLGHLVSLNNIAVLHGFADDAELGRERDFTLRSSTPFGCADYLIRLSLDSDAPFSGPQPDETRAFVPVYEIRRYILKTRGLSPTFAGWTEKRPARTAILKLLVAMYALGGHAAHDAHLALRQHQRQGRIGLESDAAAEKRRLA